jgi:Delta7-sterol 5-desaturase
MENLVLAVDLTKGISISSIVLSTISLTSLFIIQRVILKLILSDTRRIQKRDIEKSFYQLPKKFYFELFNTVFYTSLGGFSIALLRKWLIANHFVNLKFGSFTGDLAKISLDILLYIVSFDVYYYFLHRFIFHNKSLWFIHQIHHESYTPNPMTGFSFSFLESALSGGWPVFLCLFHDFHEKSLILIHIFGLGQTIVSHCGYVIFPIRWHESWVMKWFLLTPFHDFHHSRSHVNFGAYTLFLDKIFGTLEEKETQILFETIKASEKK